MGRHRDDTFPDSERHRKSRHVHKHSPKPTSYVSTKVSIRNENNEETSSVSLKVESPDVPRNTNRFNRRRLHEPVIIKDEFPVRPKRIHSPVILKDGEESQNRSYRHSHSSTGWGSRHNLNRSGLLDQSTNEPVKKQKADFGLSGKLTEDTNTYKGVVIKYNEPEDARKPTNHWRLYAFKGNQTLPILHIHRQSGFLIGRDRNIADIPMDHPSISKQHAVLQYRFVRGEVRLYIIDLESVNGTYLNNNRIEARRYYELLEKDVIKFGFSSREYVVMTSETSAAEDLSD